MSRSNSNKSRDGIQQVHANLLVGVSSVNHSGARQVVAPPGGDGQPVAAHQRSCDQLDDLKVLLQVLDDALFGGDREKGVSLLVFIMTIIVFFCCFFVHLVLLLIGLLDKGAGDLVELTQSRNHPDGLCAALLGGLQRHTCTPHNAMN